MHDSGPHGHAATGNDSAAQKLDVIDPDTVSAEFVNRVPIAFARRFGVLGLKKTNDVEKAQNGGLAVHSAITATHSAPNQAHSAPNQAHSASSQARSASLGARNRVLPVAVTSLAAQGALEKITVLLGLPTTPVLVDEDVLTQAINLAYGKMESGVEEVIEEMAPGQDAALLDSVVGDLLESAGSSTQSAPITKLVNLILLDAVKRRASDVHVQPFEDRLQVRLRIDGVLYDYAQPPLASLEEIVSRIKIMGRMNIAEKRLAQDGRTTVRVGDKVIDLRISSLPTSCGERLVLRLLDKSARLYRLPELGMNDSELRSFTSLIRRSHGILLVTGPTGSGKSTTLYGALAELDSKRLNILTLEDPIEYQLPGISQSQVSNQKGMTFATGLRTVLRQDPDVIMVGEIRDADTARMAIQSSLTGHLVLSTLHTNDAAGAVARLLDLEVEPYLVAGSLLGVLAQRLLRRVCMHCRAATELTKANCATLGLTDDHIGRTIYQAVGCERCHHTGYHDRVGIFELLVVSESLQDLIGTNPKSRALTQAASAEGMTTLGDDAVFKLLAGVTTVDELLRVTHAEG